MVNKPGVRAIRITKGSTVFHVHGDKAGQEGVWLAKGQVSGIYDAPVQTTWKTGAFQIGSTQKSRKWMHRDLTLGFHIKETFTTYEFNESKFRQIFDYEEDPWDANYVPTVIEVETELSGIRKLDVLMFEAPDFDSDIDPQQQQYGNLIMKLRAGQPFWYEDDVISTFTANTTSGSGTVTVSNPTDQTCYQKWILTPATWSLPDYKWSGGRGSRTPADSRVVGGISVTPTNGGAVVDLDRQELMFRDANNTNILGQQAGKFFEYPIPPYTQSQTLPVIYSGAPAGGATVQLRQPRRWSRPWGLELLTDAVVTYQGASLTVFNTAGPFVYRIPDGTTHVDVILLGGGGGGGGGSLLTGTGGKAGSFANATIVRGTTISDNIQYINGTVGLGGAGGPVGDNLNGYDGSPTTASCTGWSLSAAGGDGSGNTGSVQGTGSGNRTFNGKTYVGSTNALESNQPGVAPGGGGAGGFLFANGAVGARGQAWFYAYRVDGS